MNVTADSVARQEVVTVLRRLGLAGPGESEDVTIVHLAVGWGVRQLKVGAFSRSERMAKWNEALRIEEALGPEARLAGRGVFRTTGRG